MMAGSLANALVVLSTAFSAPAAQAQGDTPSFEDIVSMTAYGASDNADSVLLVGALTRGVASIPENDIYTLLLAGLGVVFFMVARRRRS
jgi:hypothetical protein